MVTGLRNFRSWSDGFHPWHGDSGSRKAIFIRINDPHNWRSDRNSVLVFFKMETTLSSGALLWGTTKIVWAMSDKFVNLSFGCPYTTFILYRSFAKVASCHILSGILSLIIDWYSVYSSWAMFGLFVLFCLFAWFGLVCLVCLPRPGECDENKPSFFQHNWMVYYSA